MITAILRKTDCHPIWVIKVARWECRWGTMLREGLERYCRKRKYANLMPAIEDIIDYMPLTRQDQPISDKTIRRDFSNKETAKQVLRIPKRRLELYARWLYWWGYR